MYKNLVEKGFIRDDPTEEVTWPWPLHLQEVVSDGSQAFADRVHASLFVIDFSNSLNATRRRCHCTWPVARRSGCHRTRCWSNARVRCSICAARTAAVYGLLC
jgi:hypothetical protein